MGGFTTYLGVIFSSHFFANLLSISAQPQQASEAGDVFSPSVSSKEKSYRVSRRARDRPDIPDKVEAAQRALHREITEKVSWIRRKGRAGWGPIPYNSEIFTITYLNFEKKVFKPLVPNHFKGIIYKPVSYTHLTLPTKA